jgi:hypothetical protein
MKDYLISSYIDDELNLDEKIAFVETVHAGAPFKDEAVDLLQQEKLLRGKVTDRVPSVTLQPGRRRALSWWRPAGMFAAGLAAAMLVMFLVTPQQEQEKIILGWEAVPMRRSGTSGYWEVVLEVPAGEHRLCYILEGGRRIPDPTIPIREKDDFGGENSILAVNLKT